jgi:hypothetical protein
MRHSPGCKCGDCNPALNDRIGGKSYAKGGPVTKTGLSRSRESFYYAHPDEEDEPEPEPRMWGPPSYGGNLKDDPDDPAPGNYPRNDRSPELGSDPDEPDEPDERPA